MDLLKGVCGLLVHLTMMGFVSGNVVLMGSNISRSFDGLEADFRSSESGVLYLAEPLDACSQLTNKVADGSKYSFALIIRGGCSFDDKVRSAQNAGFRAAIIYDFEDNAPLVTRTIQWEELDMASKYMLFLYPKPRAKYCSNMQVAQMLSHGFYQPIHHGRRERPRAPQVPEFHGMSRRLVKAMPSLMFTTVLDENCTSRTCAICLEDCNTGEELHVRPCLHKFHAMCVDSWLTAWRTFCPVCKQDARVGIDIPPASESTPLLSFLPPSPSWTASLLTCHLSLEASTSIPIVSTTQCPTASRNYSLSKSHHMPIPYRSYHNSPCQRNVPSHRSQTPLRISPHSISLPVSSSYSSRYMQPYNPSSSDASPGYLVGSSSNRHLMSSHSIGLPVPSPYGSRYMQPYDPSSSIASPSYLVGSSGRHSYLQHCESGASISGLASSHTLPSS